MSEAEPARRRSPRGPSADVASVGSRWDRGRRRVPVLLTLAALLAVLVPAGGRSGAPAAAQQTGCARLTDGQLTAQVLGAPLNQPSSSPAVDQMVAEHAGTVVLLGGAIQTAAQVRGLIAHLDGAATQTAAPLVAVDEEGGRVARFGRAGVTVHLPSARVQAAEGSPAQVQQQAAGLAAQLAALGVDYNLAPVLDLSDAAADTIIGDRSFSPDPVAAGDYGAAFAAGMGDAGIRTAAKHFPDHGLTGTDTHTDVAVVDVGLDALRAVHVEPYRRALRHIDSVMLSHLRITALDADLPASLSPGVVAFLRTELADPATGRPYDGVVVTDDLSMQAVAAVADQPTAAVRALAAGADLALVGSPSAAADAHARLRDAVATGELSRDRLSQAARRVLLLKGMDPTTVSCLVGPSHYVRPIR